MEEKMKRREKSAGIFLASCLVVIMVTACSKNEKTRATATETSEKPVTFTISTDAAGIRTEAIANFIKLLSDRSNGRIKGTELAQSSVGTGSEMAQSIQLGTLDICVNDDMTIDAIMGGQLGFAWLPGLVANYEEADKYYLNGWINDRLTEIMSINNIVRLATYCNGFRQVGNVKREVTEMSHLSGLKIRTPQVQSVVSFYEKCGALPVMIAGPEVLSALQTGTVDGLDNAVWNYVNQGITDVIKYITEINYCYTGAVIIASPAFYNKLSNSDKALFRECAKIVGDELTRKFRDGTTALQQQGIDSGQWKVSQPSSAMRASLSAIYQQIWKEAETKYDSKIMAAIIDGSWKK
jgi:TRAP-type C4-dicarboxylate transport system substrate-binding protein